MNAKTGWFLIFLVLPCFLQVGCSNEDQIYLQLIRKNENVLNFYNPDLGRFKQLLKLVLQDEGRALDKECEDSLISINDGLDRREAWALKYLESNGVARAGFLTGYHNDLGNLETCLSIESRRSTNGGLFNGQFCLISIQTPFSDAMRRRSEYQMLKHTLSNSTRALVDFALGRVQGFCLPSTCDVKQLLRPINKVLAEFELEAIAQQNCSTGTKLLDLLDWKFLLSLAVLCIPAGLSALTLLYENEWLKPFSLRDNLWNVYCREEKGELAFINGFRFLHLFTSIPAHSFGVFYMFGMVPFVENGVKTMNWSVLRPLVDRMILGMEFMFFLSGMRAYQVVYGQIKQKKSNIFKTLLRWPLQIYPSYVGYIALFTLLSYFAMPFGDYMNNILDNCKAVGWKLFTFTSNQNHAIDFCINTSWFNSVNFQLSLVHYALLFVFLRSDTLGAILSVMLLCSNVLYEAYRMYAEEIPPFMELSTSDGLSFYNIERDYFGFSSHLSPYTIGFLAGWLYKTKELTFLKIPIVAHLLTPLSFLVSFGALWFPEFFNLGLLPKSDLLLMGYFALKRVALVLFTATMLLIFKAGHYESARKWLSMKPFVVISRMAPSLVICQFMYFFFGLSAPTQSFRYNFSNLVKEILSSTILTFVYANLFLFLFEAPVCNLLKKYTLDRLSGQKLAAQPVVLDLNNNERAAKDEEKCKKHKSSEKKTL